MCLFLVNAHTEIVVVTVDNKVTKHKRPLSSVLLSDNKDPSTGPLDLDYAQTYRGKKGATVLHFM